MLQQSNKRYKPQKIDMRHSRRSIRCVKASNAKEGMPIVKLQEKTTAKTIVECDHQIFTQIILTLERNM